MRRAEADALETVRNVDLCQPDGTVAWVGVDESAQDTLQCLAKLHGLWRRDACRLLVDAGVCVIDDQPRSPVSLRYDAEWREAEMGESQCHLQGKDDPKPLLAKLEHLLADKLYLIFG